MAPRRLRGRAPSSEYVRSGDESGHSTLLLEPGPGLTIQGVMDDFYATFAEELTSRRDLTSAFVKFTGPQQLWFRQRMKVVKPVLQPGDLLLWLSGVPHCSHAAGEHKIPRRGLFITANLRRNADEKALEERWAKVKMGKLGTHNCRIATGMSTSEERFVGRSYAYDPVICSMAGGKVNADDFEIAFHAFGASVRR